MNEPLKTFNIRIPRSLWAYVKKMSIDRDQTMNSLLISLLEKQKKKDENKLTNTDANVK